MLLRRWAAAVASLVLVGGAGAWGDEEAGTEEPATSDVAVGSVAPPVVASTWLNTPEGKSPVGADPATKLLMVEFWGTWCGPCVRSMPHVQELHERYGPLGLQVVGITREAPGAVKDWVAERRYTFPIGCDPEQTTVKAYPLRGWPSTFLVDAAGKVAYVGDPYGVEGAIEAELRLKRTPGELLGAYLDALAEKRPDDARLHLRRLCEKATAEFDLRAWAQSVTGLEPPESAATKIDAAKTLDACVAAARSGNAANREKAMATLAQSGPLVFDLESWARTAFGKAHPVTRDELRAELAASRFRTALAALLDRNPTGAVLDAAARHEGLVGYCKAGRADLRADARRALMAIRYVFVDEPMKGFDEETQKRFWQEISVSGMRFDEGQKRILGILISGRMVTKEEAPGYVRRQLSLHALMTSLVDGKALKPAAAAAQAKKEEAEIVADLGQAYGNGGR